MEFYIEKGKLISEKKWKKLLSKLPSTSLYSHKPSAIDDLKKTISSAISKRSPKRLAVMFSGGIDSLILAYISKLPCICVGLSGSSDVIFAKKVSKALKLKVHFVILKSKDLDYAYKQMALKLKTKSPLSVEIASLTYFAVKKAKKLGFRNLLSGLGAEEIFGGYSRHQNASDVNAECWRGLYNTFYTRDLERDYNVAKILKINVLTPYLDLDVMKTALKIPSNWKISGEIRKLILRETAKSFGIPDKFVWKKKVAGQYGSGIDSDLEKKSKKAGLQKHEYIAFLLGSFKQGDFEIIESKTHTVEYLNLKKEFSHENGRLEELSQLEGRSLVRILQPNGNYKEIVLKKGFSYKILAQTFHIHVNPTKAKSKLVIRSNSILGDGPKLGGNKSPLKKNKSKSNKKHRLS